MIKATACPFSGICNSKLQVNTFARVSHLLKLILFWPYTPIQLRPLKGNLYTTYLYDDDPLVIV